ncbi:MAG: MBL fold metallo-hydrolase [Dehalococcoidia bacterium]|nr:MBL fold metallo-hydrolase [Dehalococcoidia bacterium]
MQQITKNVFVETGFKGCNASFVVTSAGVVMIDYPGAPTQASQWRQEIEKHAKISYLINTEPHVDHTSGGFFFPGTLVAQEGVRQSLSRPNAAREFLGWMKMVDPEGLSQVKNYQVRLPEITFASELTLYAGDHTFELYHLPGHTPSQTAIYVPQEKVLFTGDNIVYRRQPYFVESLPFQWLESLKRIGQFDADCIVPGHGEVCRDKSFVQEFSGFIQEWLNAVRNAIDRGLSKEAIMDSISFLDRYPMNPGRESFGPELQRQSASRFYDVLIQHK